ncbi:hypothetical protein D3C84_1305160 [compost metagenome]
MLVEDDDGEVVRALGHQAHALLAKAHIFFGLTAFGDVDERQDRAVDMVLA